ncbi:hypothetical protein [Serratia fonticola]|jgi:hypothetical protein|uniref:hypothetical protein n=1 Tax=Serratia fonticola TaxID=47917 RepID=UPI001415564C|nr:hypothetical protein [Serratia fonticola]NXZ88885.1 hypothetical protein [Serratia fonticola]QIP90569.1 putative membrane protein [Serratia fonticola]HBE9178341.1 hypothetical protein [Serratia fonticola]
MNFNVTTLVKAIIGGAGLGFAISGGLSMLIPAFTVTTGVAYAFAIVGAVIIGGLAAKGRVA